MRKFLVKVNGSDYEIEVEEIAGSQAAAASRPVPAPTPEAAAAPKREEAPKEEKKAEKAPAGTQGGAAASIEAPMPGSIVSVAVKPGDAVKKGQLLLVLEAMKMENEIVAPQDGTVTAVHVQAGASVDSGAPLLTIE